MSSTIPPSEPAISEQPLAPKPIYGGLETWVTKYFVHIFVRHGQLRWCQQWWDHAEAVVRLDVLWRTWEAANVDTICGLASWLDRLDSRLNALMSQSGPFASCTADRHETPGPLPTMPAPAGWWNQPPES